ncbi:NUDIX hydrolase [Streptomyces zingiberis]|uniref:NUDIX domain-containing protein n=1 Tax=Streptomyces zingiberis TaxID=2053010 RepID=A0ABX1C0M5_9ACTN|nr:NUDIX domain-containing protein [Streptomyces zingiberis]NJQ02133.1 NUDIX domain-containing protein [Streptomyces zingiberis]
MPPSPAEPLCGDGRNFTLQSFHRLPEDARPGDAEIGMAAVILFHGDRLLMVLERESATWELPGGGIEPGESPRAAAVRELAEESGQVADELRFAGLGRYLLGPHRHRVYGAVYVGRTAAPRPFTPGEEIAAIHWRAAGEPLPGRVQPVYEYLTALCAPRHHPHRGPAEARRP